MPILHRRMRSNHSPGMLIQDLARAAAPRPEPQAYEIPFEETAMTSTVLWHGTAYAVTANTFEVRNLKEAPGGFHIGSLKQARARKYPRGCLIQVEVPTRLIKSAPRLKDRGGDWAQRLKRHAAKGVKALVYLNRYEGLSPERAAELAKFSTEALDAMSDASFRRLVPEAEDSWILLDPSAARVLEIIPGAPPTLGSH